MDWTEKFADTKSEVRNLNTALPETTRAFGALGKTVKDAGAVDYKAKEYVALGIAVATKCEACIMFHVETLIKCGATREEVAEVLGMTIQMGGGPSMMYAAKALACYDALAETG
ncbi:carboxymuconolactone decarboxylase family protein [Roseovarius salinarum]|uniref:carboxymuconolactone decarboxylase family protein n=1 Tax=Roseovarius salinarum TaxID=1981892 RepID=UPI000C325DBA|nr:carboxymuconolactone decarboxylase family protein [Roseovarius salinarum]